jgi:hypothetical protein
VYAPPGARVSATLIYPRQAHGLRQSFGGRTDRHGRLERLINVPYRPPAGTRAGAPATIVALLVRIVPPGTGKATIELVQSFVVR